MPLKLIPSARSTNFFNVFRDGDSTPSLGIHIYIYTYRYIDICTIYSHSHVHNGWFYSHKTFIFIPFLWGCLGHCISMKSNNREPIISPWKLLKHLIILSVMWEETWILSLCASFKPHFDLGDNSSQFQLGQERCASGSERRIFPVPSEMSSHPQGCFDFTPGSPRIHSGCVNIYIS